MELSPGSDLSVPVNYDPNAVYRGEWVRFSDGLIGQSFTVLPGTTSNMEASSGVDPQPEPQPVPITSGSDPSVPVDYDPNAVYRGEWVRFSDGLIGQSFTVLPGTTSDVTDPSIFTQIEPMPEPVPVFAGDNIAASLSSQTYPHNPALDRFLSYFGF